jgi:hypothetical protein
MPRDAPPPLATVKHQAWRAACALSRSLARCRRRRRRSLPQSRNITARPTPAWRLYVSVRLHDNVRLYVTARLYVIVRETASVRRLSSPDARSPRSL